ALVESLRGAECDFGIVRRKRCSAEFEQLIERARVGAFPGEDLKNDAARLQLLAKFLEKETAWRKWLPAGQVADFHVYLQVRNAIEAGLSQVGHFFRELLLAAAVPDERERVGHTLLPIADEPVMLRGEDDLPLDGVFAYETGELVEVDGF